MRGWYILHTLSTQEKRVCEMIKSKIADGTLKNIVYDVRMPVEKVVEMREGKKIEKEQKFYPGYVLIDMEMNFENMNFIRKLPGVTHFLGARRDKLPKPLSQKEISSILKKEEEAKEVESSVSSKIKFVINGPVKIIDGPFKGFQGIVEEVNMDKGRVKVRVEIFGRPTPIELNFLQVEKI